MTKRERKNGIYFMVTDEERNQINERMDQAGIRSLRAYLLKMALNGYILKLDLSDVKQLVYLLSNATNNMNQISKRVNETHNIYAEDINDLQEKYNGIWELAKGILNELAKLNNL